MAPGRRAFPLAGGLGAALLVQAVTVGAVAAAQEFHVDTDSRRMVRFISRAPIEDFEGVTEKIDGYVVLPEGGLAGPLGQNTEFLFEVDLASLDTGIGLRNRHMRDNYLETDEHPYATYNGRIARAERAGAGYRLSVTGQMEIHGISRSLDMPCEATQEGQGYRVRCAWSVLLSDYDIEIPRLMFLKINEEIRLEVDFAVRPAESAQT